MRVVKIIAPKGNGQTIASLAFESNISKVSLMEAKVLHKVNGQTLQDVIEFESTTNKAKEFIEALMEADIYNPETYSFTTRHPESIFADEPPEKETDPIIRPTTDVYEELWQFCLITKSLIGRLLISSFLLAYGIREDYMPLIIAGLLFLPFHHHLLGMALGAGIKEWRFLRQGIYVFLVATACIISGGAIVALLTEPDIKWTAFTETPLHFSFLISMVIGIAAALAATDDAGRRELIGLAATAHVSIYPVWFGIKLIHGFDANDEPLHYFLVFLMDVFTIVVFSILTFKWMKMKGKGISRFVRDKERRRG